MRITYIEEANELLGSLEVALLALEDNPNDKTNIEQVFRVMHTLKGNSSMFGLTLIAEFVHDLETIYDKIRAGEMSITRSLLNCTLASLDHLKVIIHDSELNDGGNKATHSKLIKQIQTFISDSGALVSESLAASASANVKAYHIYFAPGAKIFEDGSNPLYLVNELYGMGKAQAVPHFSDLASYENFIPSECYCCWDIFLETEKTINDIKDVFVFVEQCSEIKITELSYENLLSDDAFQAAINKRILTDRALTAEEISELAAALGKTQQVNNKTDEREAHNAEKEAVGKKNVIEKTASSIRVSSEKLDELMRLVSELVTTQASLSLFTETHRIVELETIAENVEKLSRRLRDIAFGMTLVPINSMFGRFNRMVRDISAQLGKEVEFVTEGGETELDKTIIESLTDPLMHILRNSLDHGIESAAERQRKGKTQKGKVMLKAYYSGVFVYIQISDDGKGLDQDAIRAKAVSKGIIAADQVLSEKETFDLIFCPGFSTAEKVTDVSGRGVGMDVVKRNITDLKGSIFINSRFNEGTTLTIRLPLTLSIIDGLLVNVDGINYVIPLAVVTKCFEVEEREMQNNFHQLLTLDGEQVPFINLRKEFSYTSEPPERTQIIVVTNDVQKVGISVDSIVGEYQAVVKPIGKYYRNQDFVSGATILGDGTIALVLDTHKIVELYCEKIKTEE